MSMRCSYEICHKIWALDTKLEMYRKQPDVLNWRSGKGLLKFKFQSSVLAFTVWPYTLCLAALSAVSLFFLYKGNRAMPHTYKVLCSVSSITHKTRTNNTDFHAAGTLTLPPHLTKLVNVSVKETFSKFIYTSSTGVFSLRDWMLIRQRSTLRNLVSHGEDTRNWSKYSIHRGTSKHNSVL